MATITRGTALRDMAPKGTEHKVMETYGAYGEKMMYGKKTIGVIRTTYIIGKDGKVLKIYRKVNTATHGEDVRKALAELG